MGRQAIVAALVGLIFAAGLVCAQAPDQPRIEHERSVAEANPDAPPPQAVKNMPLSSVDGRTVAVYSILWLLAIVLAVSAILRAEYTDRYHEHT